MRALAFSRALAIAVVLVAVALGAGAAPPSLPPTPSPAACLARCDCWAPHVLLCVEDELTLPGPGAPVLCADMCACDDDARVVCVAP